MRVARAVIRWSQLATRKETSGSDTKSLASVSLEDCETTQEALAKQIVVSSGTLEQGAFLMERCYEMRMEKFLEVGTAVSTASRTSTSTGSLVWEGVKVPGSEVQ